MRGPVHKRYVLTSPAWGLLFLFPTITTTLSLSITEEDDVDILPQKRRERTRPAARGECIPPSNPP